jgi:hypothetical protein
MFMIMLQDFMDPWTFNQKNVMKCCKEFLLPGGKQIPFAHTTALATALPIDGYVVHFETAGLGVVRVEPHDEALTEMVRQIRGRLVGAELLSKLQRPDLTGVSFDFEQARLLARRAGEAIAAGALGYTLIVASSQSCVCQKWKTDRRCSLP